MKVQRFTIKTADFGDIPVLRPIPTEERISDTLVIDPWGVLAPVRDLVPVLAALVPVVTGEEWSHALHGHARPLMLKIGPTPKALLKLTPLRECIMRTKCVMYDSKRCVPGTKLPECWWPGVAEDARRAAALITLTWAEGRYVVVVAGVEFNLKAGRT